MARHRPNRSLVKLHRNYTVEEIARLLGVNRQTVRRWIAAGLEVIDDQKPMLVLGHVLHEYLGRKRSGSGECPPGHCYCVKCRAPRWPDGDMAEYFAMSTTSGNLRALCPTCGSLMHRRIGRTKLDELAALLDITIAEGRPRLVERPHSFSNVHSDKESQ
jgi:hypothetical protein